jgi:hypothetical protein
MVIPGLPVYFTQVFVRHFPREKNARGQGRRIFLPQGNSVFEGGETTWIRENC